MFYQDNHIKIYNKDCRFMTELPGESVQCVVTSPPYWGLRKYSGEQELIWGDKDCEHSWVDDPVPGEKSGPPGPNATVGARFAQDAVRRRKPTNTCVLCGAWKGAYGLEPTPEMYIEHTIEILREIRRVLRKDGVVFWNIGDSYATSHAEVGTIDRETGWKSATAKIDMKEKGRTSTRGHPILKPKDLCLIPFRVAIAAQEDGWWVRSVIIWSKPNPMPESVTDRPTESHEYLLMLTQSGKSLYWTHRDGGGTREKPKKADYRWVNQLSQEEVAIEPPDWKVKIKCPNCEATGTISVYLGLDVWQEKKCDTCHGKKETQLWKRKNLWKGHDYYWDADAVREPAHPETWGVTKTGDYFGEPTKDYSSAGAQNPADIKRRIGSRVRGLKTKGLAQPSGHETYHGQDIDTPVLGRNIRSVWEFPTQPYPEAHFAVFPEKLPEICIKAATPEVGCCSKCGAPWERVTKPTAEYEELLGKDWNIQERDKAEGKIAGHHRKHNAPSVTAQYETLGWQPICKCNVDKIPSIVLDPFLGAGTTLWVAKRLNRKAVGYEISKEYCQLAVDRCRQQVLL